jgi:hypothetical protein
MKSVNTGFHTAQATVGTTPTLIVAARAGRDTVIIENMGTTSVFLGDANVSATNGLLLPGAVGASVALETTDAIYGITVSGTQAVCAAENYG